MLESIDVLEMHDFVRDLLDHVINPNEKMLYSFSITAELTGQRDHA